MPVLNYRLKAKRKKEKKNKHRELKGIVLFAAAFILGYCLVIPSQAGEFGRMIAKISFLTLGQSAHLIPLFLIWWGINCFKPEDQVQLRLDAVLSVIALLLASSFMSLSGYVPEGPYVNYGGVAGLKLNPFFRRLFGRYLALFINGGLFVYIVSLLLRISIKDIIAGFKDKIIEDYKQWQKARDEWKKAVLSKAKVLNSVKETPAPAPLIPKVVETPKINEKRIVERIVEKVKPSKTEILKPETAVPETKKYVLPSADLLKEKDVNVQVTDKEFLYKNAEFLTKTLADFGVTAAVKEVIPGPVVTRYDIELAPGIKIQTVSALSENIALAMKTFSIRIVPVPEKSAVGVEVPNTKSSVVGLKGIIQSDDFQDKSSLLKLALGRTTDGVPYVADLASMPHLLIAGATGSGKSVCIHSLIMSILYKAKPDEVKFLMIDPKRLELPLYKGLPHLYDPRVPPEKADIITQPKQASDTLKKLVRIMELRYEKFAKETVRSIVDYNEKMEAANRKKEFYIVVVIDELADLMLIATKEVEDSIQRLAQMARAVGIHLILATQRPSVDVITGVIKANFPARIAFQTTSKVDSRVILDVIGAEYLLGKGDMLFLPPGESKPIRLQGAFVTTKEAQSVVNFIKEQGIQPLYEDFLVKRSASAPGVDADEETINELVRASKLVLERKRVSQDLLKAHFGSSARATNVLSLLETKGFIHKPEGTNRWSIHFDKIEEFLDSAGNRGEN